MARLRLFPAILASLLTGSPVWQGTKTFFGEACWPLLTSPRLSDCHAPSSPTTQ